MIENTHIFQRIVEQATDLIYILDLDLRVVWLNRHAVEVFLDLLVPATAASLPEEGETDEARARFFLGRPLDELFRADDVAFVRRWTNEVKERGETVEYDHTISPTGKQVHFSTKLIPIRDDHGEVRQILGITRDVTEKWEVDQRIYNAEKLASIGILAAGIAHEINNPLAVILGFTDLLLERFEAGSREHEDLKLIEYNANHAARVVEELLGFARVTEGMQDTIDVAASLRTVIAIVRRTLLTRKIALEVQMDASLPTACGDPREFQQVVFNLVNNAIAAMEGGGVLGIRASATDGWVTVEVTDTGVGIPERIQPRVFDPFFTTKKVGQGTGLGLSLCYGIVRKHRGRIHFKSSSWEDRPNEPSGSMFCVELPTPEERDTARREK